MAKPAYAGPKPLAEALSELRLARGEDAKFHREGLRADSEYRDLGLAAATGGRLGMRHIRAVGGDFSPTGWHWHDMQAHFIYVLKGLDHVPLRGRGGRRHGERRLRAVAARGRAAQRDRAL